MVVNGSLDIFLGKFTAPISYTTELNKPNIITISLHLPGLSPHGVELVCKWKVAW